MNELACSILKSVRERCASTGKPSNRHWHPSQHISVHRIVSMDIHRWLLKCHPPTLKYSHMQMMVKRKMITVISRHRLKLPIIYAF